MSDHDVKSCQLPSHIELPVVLVQDFVAGFESVDLEPIPESVLKPPRLLVQSVLCKTPVPAV